MFTKMLNIKTLRALSKQHHAKMLSIAYVNCKL